MQPEVGRLVVVDVFKSMALIIVLVLEMLAVPLSCRGVDCNWTQPLFYFEYMSGLFFVIHGLGIGLSVCRQVTSHRTGVMRLVLARSLVMIIAGAICQSAQQWLEQHVVHHLLQSGAVNWRAALEIDVSDVLRGAVEKRALIYHGVCGLLSSSLLLLLLRARLRPWAVTVSLLGTAAVILASGPMLHHAADRVTCCAPPPASQSVPRFTAEQVADLHELRHCWTTDAVTDPFRIPASCAVVSVIDGRVDSGRFDPCNASGHGPAYVPYCGDDDAPADLADGLLCQRHHRSRLASAVRSFAVHSSHRSEAEKPPSEREALSRLSGRDVSKAGAAGVGAVEGADVGRADGDVSGDDDDDDGDDGGGGGSSSGFDDAADGDDGSGGEDGGDADLMANESGEAGGRLNIGVPGALHASTLPARRGVGLTGASVTDGGSGAASPDQPPPSSPVAELSRALPSSIVADFTARDAPASVAACRARLVQRSGTPSTRRLHGMAQAQLGQLWCPALVESPLTGTPEAVAYVCPRRPWWGREAGLRGEEVAALSTAQLVGALALQQLFGLHGVFAYAVPSLVGTAIGHRIHSDGGVSLSLVGGGMTGALASLATGAWLTFQLRQPARTDSVPGDGGVLASLRHALMLGESAAEPLLPPSLVATADATSQAQMPLPAEDAFLRAGSHTRLLFGAGDVAILLTGLW